MRLRLITLVTFLVVLLIAPMARAEDRVIVRGNYYREDSTRVLQPMVSYQKEVAGEKLTIGADYLLDAITSASIGAGAQQLGGDRLFTEIRHETSLSVGSRLGEWGLGGFFRYSTETDYESRSTGASVSRDFLERTLTLSAAYSYGNDSVYRITGPGTREQWKSLVDDGGNNFVQGPTNIHQTHYLSLGYSHVLARTLRVGAGLESVLATGPQENPYRVVQNGLEEIHPLMRRRLAPSASLNWAIPKARMVIEPRYRYYVDDWDIRAHSIDTRLHFRVVEPLRVRLRYRYYTQTSAFFWKESARYNTWDDYRTADPKMGHFLSHTPGIEITLGLDALAKFRGLGWLDGAWVQGTYNHIFQTNRFGNARLGSLAFSLAF